MAEHDDLVRDLAALGRTIQTPAPSGALATAVLERLPADVGGTHDRRRVALVVGAVTAVLLALLATPPVRATVADWFGFGGVRAERDESDFGTPGPPPGVSGVESVSAAAAAVGFPVFVPEELGDPDGVAVSDDRRMVSMSWTTDEVGVVRLDQLDGRLDFSVAKRSPGVHYAAVDGTDALWFERPHEVALLRPDGSPVTYSARLAGHTLIWQEEPTTLRLEGDVGLERAVEIAESAEPVG